MTEHVAEQAPADDAPRKEEPRRRGSRFYIRILVVVLLAYLVCWLASFLILQHTRGRYFHALMINGEVVSTSAYLRDIDPSCLTSTTDLKINRRPHHTIPKPQAEDSHSVFVWDIIATDLRVSRATASMEDENIQHASYNTIISSDLKERK